MTLSIFFLGTWETFTAMSHKRSEVQMTNADGTLVVIGGYQANIFFILLTNWFAGENVDDMIIFIKYLVLFLFRFVALLTIMCNSNLEDGFMRSPS